MASMIPPPGQVMAWTMDVWRKVQLAAEQVRQPDQGRAPTDAPGPSPRPSSDPSAPPQVW